MMHRRRILEGLGLLSLPHVAWPRNATAASSSFNDTLLNEAVDHARSLDQLHGLVIARHGEIAVAEAFRGPPIDSPVNVKSVSKTIVASLAGIALDRGLIDGTEQRLTSIIPDLVPKRADPRVNQITLADLLTMRAGLERTSGRHYGRWVESDNWVAHALSRPFVAEPGARMLYSTGSYHLLGVAIVRAGGTDLRTLARRWLGDPLGIEIPPWTRDPQGHFMGGNNMALAPLALHHFGEMWRQGGHLSDRQVISRNWIKQSWQPRTRSPFSGDSYGYGWFLDSAAGHGFSYARGYGGQMLYIVPSLALTVTVTSDSTRPARSHGYAGALKSLLVDRLIPAAIRA